jgi:hypothetical protein
MQPETTVRGFLIPYFLIFSRARCSITKNPSPKREVREGPRRAMLRNLSISVLSMLLLTGSSTDQGWWDKKPYLEWSADEADRMLNDSPWVGIIPLRLARQSNYPLNLRVLPLTAQPIREAYLRRLSFPADVEKGPDFETTIPADQAKAKDKMEESRARLDRFIRANQGDIRVRGDDRHIVITMVLTQFVPLPTRWGDVPGSARVGVMFGVGQTPWLEDPRPGLLMGLQLSDWLGNTFLSTSHGKRAGIVRYDPPALDLLGAKFYFPRRVSDGTGLIGNRDTELLFETRIGGRHVRVKFDLRKMMYKGKLEI